VQACSSKISIFKFQCNTTFSISINYIFVNPLPYVLEFHNNIVSWVQYHDMYRIVAWWYRYNPSFWYSAFYLQDTSSCLLSKSLLGVWL